MFNYQGKENISYWTFGDICGKRLNSCATRFGFEGDSEIVKNIRMEWDTSVDPPKNGQGDGYASAPAVTVGTTWTANVELEVGDNIAYGDYHYRVTVSDGQAGTTAPTHTSGVAAPGGDGVTYKFLGVRATATANLGVSAKADKVVTYTMTTTQSLVGGSGYDYVPAVTVGAPDGDEPRLQAYAGARVNLNTTQSVDLPFGGFPGSALF